MFKTDLHIHTTFSDGKDIPEDIVLSAIEYGIDKIGFSDHSYTPFDESYCIKKDKIKEYKDTINALKHKYSDKIEILLGIEQDYHSDDSVADYDYIIGSVHYIKVENNYIPVDESAKILMDACNKYFCGNIYELINVYYKTVSDVVNKTSANIVGHFDLITKFNENGVLFDESDARYINAYKAAADKLLKTNAIFEINTGPISRKYKTTPYPSNDIYKYLKDNGAKFILSSDSHSKDTLCYDFDKLKNLI